METWVKVLIGVSFLFIFVGTTVTIDYKTRSCLPAHQFNNETSLCFYPSVGVCNEGERFENNQCVYDKISIFESNGFWVIILIVCVICLIVTGFYIYMKFRPKEETVRNISPDEAIRLFKIHWAEENEMFMVNGEPLKEAFTIRSRRIHFTPNKEKWLLCEIDCFTDSSRTNRSQGMFVLDLPLSRGENSILSGDYLIESGHKDNLQQIKGMPTYTSEDPTERAMEFLSREDPDLYRNVQLQKIMQNFDKPKLGQDNFKTKKDFSKQKSEGEDKNE